MIIHRQFYKNTRQLHKLSKDYTMKNFYFTFFLLTTSFLFAQEKEIMTAPIDTKSALIKQSADIWDVFKSRRSVRKFKSDSIPEADILKIIDAARLAPTSGNQQPWKFLIVRDKNKINQMKESCIKSSLSRYETTAQKEFTKEQFEEKVRANFDKYFSAPVYIIILTDNTSMYPNYNHWDGPMAAAYLMLAARALGYGTVFITDSVPESVTKDVLGIPDMYTRVCFTPLGIPVEWPQSPSKKRLEDFIIYNNF
jgi:nitroreductase